LLLSSIEVRSIHVANLTGVTQRAGQTLKRTRLGLIPPCAPMISERQICSFVPEGVGKVADADVSQSESKKVTAVSGGVLISYPAETETVMLSPIESTARSYQGVVALAVFEKAEFPLAL
jgi:hypothetical protein